MDWELVALAYFLDEETNFARLSDLQGVIQLVRI